MDIYTLENLSLREVKALLVGIKEISIFLKQNEKNLNLETSRSN